MDPALIKQLLKKEKAESVQRSTPAMASPTTTTAAVTAAIESISTAAAASTTSGATASSQSRSATAGAKAAGRSADLATTTNMGGPVPVGPPLDFASLFTTPAHKPRPLYHNVNSKKYVKKDFFFRSGIFHVNQNQNESSS